MNILVANVGSSSVKLSVIDTADRTVVDLDVPLNDPSVLDGSLRSLLNGVEPIGAVGHRAVHAGPLTRGAVHATADVEQLLLEWATIDPLHNPGAVQVIRAVRRLSPQLAQVVCLDTAFHSTLGDAAATYAVPWRWTSEWGVRKLGFHGLSYAWATGQIGGLLGLSEPPPKLIVAHLGSGASLAAVDRGKCVDTTMGFSPLDGLVMSSRPGTVDPGILLWVAQRKGLSSDAISQALNHESGLLGIAGISGDLRQVLKSADAGNVRAQLAYDVYQHRLRSCIGSMAASLGGVDCLIFTGGIGEHQPRVRADACIGLRFLGLDLDAATNMTCTDTAVISPSTAPTVVAVVTSREDIQVARETRRLLADSSAETPISANSNEGLPWHEDSPNLRVPRCAPAQLC